MKQKLLDLLEVLPQIMLLGLMLLVMAACIIIPIVVGIVKFLAYWRVAFGG